MSNGHCPYQKIHIAGHWQIPQFVKIAKDDVLEEWDTHTRVLFPQVSLNKRVEKSILFVFYN